MNHIYAKTLPKLLSGSLNFANGLIFDLIVENQPRFDKEFISDIPLSNRLNLPVTVPLSISEGVASANPDPKVRQARFATSDDTTLYGVVAYLPSGELLFYCEFGDIRHAKDGLFTFVYPRDLVTLRVHDL